MPARKLRADTEPTTLREVISYFSDADRAHEFIVKLRFPNGVACPRQGCSSANVGYITTRRMWQCKDCKKQSSVKVGTIFEDSPIGFDKWLPAMWMLGGDRNGISSHELARAIGVTQKTAWFMLHRIRLAMKEKSLAPPLSGEAEADETFVGGRKGALERNPLGFKTLGHGPGTGETTVFGIIERESRAEKRRSRVRAVVVPDHKRATLMPRIYESVLLGSILYTDALRSYRATDHDYIHKFIDHSLRYVEGHVHTNNIETFWSCLKRTLHGTYMAPRAFHLAAYVDEQVFRFNAREQSDADHVKTAFEGVDGRRITYWQLTKSRRIWRLKPGRAKKSPLYRA